MQRQKLHTKKNKKVRSKKVLYFGILGLVVVALAGFGIWKLTNRNSNGDKNIKTTANKGTNSNNDTSKVNYDPPTPTDKSENDQHKDQLVQEQQQPPTPTSNVTPTITSYGQYDGNIEISSIVPGIIEDGGTCTLTATMGSNTVTKQVTGVRNAQDTSCPTFVIPRNQFAAAGNWTIVVKYSSSTHSGTSDAKTLKVE